MCIKGHVEYMSWFILGSFLNHQVAINPIGYLVYEC